MKNVIILGAGLSGLSTAYFLQEHSNIDTITILEKEETTGGLCRTIKKGNYLYDIGPHILFSKDKEMLTLLLNMLDGKNQLKRSNQIYFKGRKIQYPFENDLSKLTPDDLDYCIQAFNNNPYENYEATNMIQFFLKTFGEGITNTYLRPYNEKIWKYDPSFMNTSMVDRIPKPTKDEIKRSASGETVDGYLHQLYFHYPTSGGIQSIVDGLVRKLDKKKCHILTNQEVNYIERAKNKYFVKTNHAEKLICDQLISTIPIQELAHSYAATPQAVCKCVDDLRYNSIAIAFVKTPYDRCQDHFTYNIPERDIIFHRISKMDFLGSEYHHCPDEATYMVEVTYRKNDLIDVMNNTELFFKIQQGMCQIDFAERSEDVKLINLTRHQYAYVVYDLNHASNMTHIRQYFDNEGVLLNGRFGNYEYWNMDRILRESYELSNRLL